MKPVRIVIFPVFVILLHSCIPCYYAPNAHNVPLLKESGTGNASLGMKIGLYYTGFDLQGAMALTDHLGLMVNYSYFSGTKDEPFISDFAQNFKSHMAEIGLGYYKKFDDMLLFEAYGGAGLDWIFNTYNSGVSGTSNLTSACYFFQPAFGFYVKNVELALSMRMRIVNFIGWEFDESLDQYMVHDINNISRNSVFSFLEPAFTFRSGGKKVKFQFQVGFSQILGGNHVEYDPLNLNFGVIFTFGKRKKAEAAPPG